MQTACFAKTWASVGCRTRAARVQQATTSESAVPRPEGKHARCAFRRERIGELRHDWNIYACGVTVSHTPPRAEPAGGFLCF